jgi:hypothetical protein
LAGFIGGRIICQSETDHHLHTSKLSAAARKKIPGIRKHGKYCYQHGHISSDPDEMVAETKVFLSIAQSRKVI